MARKKKRRRQRTRILVPRRAQPGAPPGTLTVLGEAAPARLHVFVYNAQELTEKDVSSVKEVASLRAAVPAPTSPAAAGGAPPSVLWVNIEGVGDPAVVKELGEVFGLHALALEDVVHVHQRPKAEDYGDHAFIVMRMPLGSETLDLEQVSIFVGPGFVVTVQEGRPGDCLEPMRQRLREGRGKIRSLGADFLAYSIIDAIVDNYFPVLERFNERLEDLEGQVLLDPTSETMFDIYAVRHDLHALRRVLAPLRQAIGLLVRGDVEAVGQEVSVFMRDCLDHTAQLQDTVDACTDLSVGLVDLHLSQMNNRTSEGMRVLTVIATIFIPLTFIAGLYGMNFDRGASPFNMPELGWYLGYPFALFLMLATGVGFLIYFWRKGWLSKPSAPPATRETPPPSSTAAPHDGRG